MSWANFISIRYLSRLNSRSDSKTAKTRKRALSVAALIASTLADALTLSTVNVAIISGLLRFARTRLMSVPGEFLSRDALLRMTRSEEHTSELQTRFDLVCRLLLE